jgi:uncharacterized membrane-anchored protein YhcB (DUF1043 family)
MKWVMYLAGIAIGGCIGFFAGALRGTRRETRQAQKTQAVIQELQAMRGEMHATQQELWRR